MGVHFHTSTITSDSTAVCSLLTHRLPGRPMLRSR